MIDVIEVIDLHKAKKNPQAFLLEGFSLREEIP